MEELEDEFSFVFAVWVFLDVVRHVSETTYLEERL